MRDAQVFSGYYLARFPGLEGFSLLLQGTKQNSDVSTLGSIAVAGKGSIFGVRGIFTLPPGQDFYESISAGFDWKHFDQRVGLSTGNITTPITYYPVSAVYTATWVPKGSETDLDAGITFGLRGGIGSKEEAKTINSITAASKPVVTSSTSGAICHIPMIYREACRFMPRYKAKSPINH